MEEKTEIFIIKKENLTYPENYNPSSQYPEYLCEELSEENNVYHSIRELFKNMGLDKENFGKTTWNPLGEIIKPGQKVLIKPNFVRDFNPVEKDITSLVTNGSIIRAIVDYCYIALKGRGSLVIGDAPVQSANFDVIKEFEKMDEVIKLYRTKNFNIEIIDFRKKICERDSPVDKVSQEGDPKGYTIVDLQDESCHANKNVDFKRFRVTNYDPDLMRGNHNDIQHKYLISSTVLSADVVINIPKLKTHRKAGLTCALKNLIGINCLKDYLPHHTKGSKNENGDEYLYKDFNKALHSFLDDTINRSCATERLKLGLLNLLMKINGKIIRLKEKDPFSEGSWYGNDTLWRTILDLNKILFYCDEKGVMSEKKQRKVFTLVDGIVAGEKEGPLEPTSKHCGLLLAGHNPVAVDYAASIFMGFDYLKIPQINNAFNIEKYPLIKNGVDDIEFYLNGRKSGIEGIKKNSFIFIPPAGWMGHI